MVVRNADAIAENWRREIAANPALFDGRMIFHSRVGLSPEGISSEGHEIPFSAFMWWRRQEPRPEGIHIFAYPVIESADGALVAIRMGSHTANPGQVYFAAGSLEACDVVDGVCDLEANMRREVMEETGLDLGQAIAGEHFHASHHRSVLAISKWFRFDLTAQEIATRIEAHMKIADDKEIAGPVIIRSADPTANSYNISMHPVLDWYFNRSA